jgi:hypothetical protein
MRQRANGISAMGSLCSYSVCTLTHRAFDPFARPHSDLESKLFKSKSDSMRLSAKISFLEIVYFYFFHGLHLGMLQ